MSKAKETGAATVSKYAAKKAARAKAIMEEANQANSIVETSNDEVVQDAPKQNIAAANSYKGRQIKKHDIPSTAHRYPEHFVQIALLIKNNAEIRRFTSLGILNYLYQKGAIKGTDGFVSFKWNKFAVKYKGLICEYAYSEPFFLNALVASFISFSASAQRTIDKFCKIELMIGINKAIDSEEVEAINKVNEKHYSSADIPANEEAVTE